MTIPESKHHSGSIGQRLCNPLWVISASLFVLAFCLPLLKNIWMEDVLLFLLTFGPMIVSLILGAAVVSRSSFLILLVSNILYFGWFLWVYLDDSALGFFFVGIYSLPVMIPLWIIALSLRRYQPPNSEQDTEVELTNRLPPQS